MNSGNPRRALEELDLGWKIMRELAPAAQDTDKRLARRARINAQLGNFAEALVEFRQAAELAAPRGNLANLATIRIGEADLRVQTGRFEQARLDLDAAAAALRQARLSPTSLISVRYELTRAEWLAARGDSAAARDALTKVLSLYESQNCCRATRSLALAERAMLELDDLDDADADATSARELAPLPEADSFSRFTGSAWYATALVLEARGKFREARDAFATAAVQFAGALGDSHADTVRARAGIARASAAATKNDN
jgi:tetratricopeptide (TPR) repeat protein